MKPFTLAEEFRQEIRDISVTQPTDGAQITAENQRKGLETEALQDRTSWWRIIDKRPLSSDEEVAFEEVNQEVSAATMRLDNVRRLTTPSSRIIAHTLYAPPLGLAPSHSSLTNARWVRDWALLELHARKHTTNLLDLRNQVSLRPVINFEEVRNSFRLAGLDTIPRSAGVMKLAGVIPEEEILSSADTLVVGKYGATTGLTYGVSNNAMSLRREPQGLVFEPVEEWCVFGLPSEHGRPDAFSRPGDSGSAVWDAKTGRIGGLLIGGRGVKDEVTGHIVDWTYVTPMERLLHDIKSSGFNVSIPVDEHGSEPEAK